jgi:hypothetical protein
MNKTVAEGADMVREISDAIESEGLDLTTVIVAPPSLALESVVTELWDDEAIAVAAQNCHQADSGAFTGEISAPMLADLDVDAVILGHSERRQYFGETNEILAQKVDSVLKIELVAIFCVGEVLEERKSGKHQEVVASQLKEALLHLSADDFENIVDARDYKGHKYMTYNLKLYSAFATDYGNVTFTLKGYKNAETVILSGSFNRWDESGFVMKPTNEGWEITLQLKPDIYQYKFIIDKKHWIEDPQNPSKVENEFGGYNSVIDVQKMVEFKLCNYSDAKTVVLSGDFNKWSKDDDLMTKIDGCWVYNKKLSGGKYQYKFIVDGNWITDPKNSVKEYDNEGNINSVCMVK